MLKKEYKLKHVLKIFQRFDTFYVLFFFFNPQFSFKLVGCITKLNTCL